MKTFDLVGSLLGSIESLASKDKRRATSAQRVRRFIYPTSSIRLKLAGRELAALTGTRVSCLSQPTMKVTLEFIINLNFCIN